MRTSVQVEGTVIGDIMPGEDLKTAKLRLALEAEMAANENGKVRIHLNIKEKQ